jgi:4-hydroxybenzoate polyprenyltransferase
MTHTDIKSEGWISKLPENWRPYAILMRLDRPIGWWLLLLPGWWGITLGANGVSGMYASDVRLLIYFFIGAVLMRGAGCIVNDLWDRDLDKQVARTQNRPLASGQVSIFQAAVLLFSLLFISFIILVQTSAVTVLIGIFSLIFIVAYPYMKRVTWWPQAFLGITFNLGALMGYGAATHHLGWVPFFLYIAGFFWTLGYDTIYAHQDKDDDALVGIKSTALLFGSRSKVWVSLFYVAAMGLICLASILAGSSLISLALLILPALHLIRQVSDWEMDDAYDSLEVFKSNRNFGLLVLFSFAFSDFNPHIGFLDAVLQ